MLFIINILKQFLKASHKNNQVPGPIPKQRFQYPIPQQFSAFARLNTVLDRRYIQEFFV